MSRVEEDKLIETEQNDLLGYRTELKADDFAMLIYEVLLRTGVTLDIPFKVVSAGNYPVALCDRRCYCVTEGLTQKIMNAIVAQYGQEFDTLYYLSDCPALSTSHTELEAAIKLAGEDRQVEVLSFY
ncbi:MAG: hypothetical protein ISN29_05350 [Gammaproteobacteria bacterium AqS3]|nr:hypothetical protein [Gammaproteobacteria bacterium AqS3]